MKSAVTSVRTLSIVEVSVAMRACAQNAEELIQEATLLVTSGHSARAFFIYHTACEELAKFLIFEGAGKRIAQGDIPNWKRFWQRLRSHDSKLAHIEIRTRVPVKAEASEDSVLIRGALDLFLNYGALPRNTCLYVDLDPGGAFRRPSEIDWGVILPSLKALAEHLLRTARESGERPEEIERALHQPPNDKMREQVLHIMTNVIEQMKASGMSKDEVLKRLQALSNK